MNDQTIVRAKRAMDMAEADRSFAPSLDVMKALHRVEMCAREGLALPPNLARWLARALADYTSGRAATMDAAMGLNQRGKPPRRLMLERGKLQSALGRMEILHWLGATVEQAATLVGRLSPDFSERTLSDRYARSGQGRRARQHRRMLRLPWWEVEDILAEYPDKPLAVAQAKDAIRKLYPRSRI